MLPSPALYFAFLAVCGALLAIVSVRTDRVLGWIVVFALAVNVTGASLMGWWVQRMHGRQYSGGDEVAYQWEGERLLAAWRRGDTSYVRGTVGIYAPINAGVIAVAGPGHTPMRVTTALVGAIGVSAAFWLAMLLYGSVVTARVAACLSATSPLLILFSWMNLRDRWIGTAALLVLIAAVLTIQRPTWRRGFALMVSLWILGELRHYWATLLGYLAIAGCLLLGAGRWPSRIVTTAFVATAVGCALWMVTGTVLGVDIRHETGLKYVTLRNATTPPASVNASTPPGVGTLPSPAAPPSGTAPDGKPPIPYSGPTLGETRVATWPDNPRELMDNVAFVLFGRLHARGDGGQYASLFLLPEALWSFLLLPLAIAGVVAAIRRGQPAVLIPAAYVGAIIAVLSWLHGDEWTTYRFRNFYWPVLLILAAGGISQAYGSWRTPVNVRPHMGSHMKRTTSWLCVLVTCSALLWPAGRADAQGVTTSAVAGVVKDAQGAVIPGATVTAVHQPSGSTYEAITQGDGRFFIQGMRIGGPYTITAALSGFRSAIQNDVSLTLGVVQDLSFALTLASLSETVTVTAEISPVFSSTRTGAATSVTRDELAILPTVSGRINDITRLTPQYGGSGTFAGQDNRMNNITVDGSYFNNSFGLGGQPGDRTGVAPISLEAIEQIQVSVAPFDVRQGNFVGAGVNTVTRSGTNRLTASIYRRFRNESFVGTEAKGLVFNPGVFNTHDTGAWMGGPLITNKLFAFGSFEKQDDTRPLTAFRANLGAESAAGSVTRVLASDLTSISALLSSKFTYDTGPFEGVDKLTPAKPFLVKADYNLNNSNKISFRFSRLDSSSDQILSTSSSLGLGRSSGTNTTFLGFKSSNYSILENYRSGIGEWNSAIGHSMANSLTVGYTTNDESRADPGKLFPFVDILDGAGVAYTSIGTEPFTPNNELRYKTFQLQDSFTKVSSRHSWTFGGSLEKYNSENVFFPGKQSAYVYNSLADFYTDLNGYVADPARTTSPVTLRRFQVRYTNIPGQAKPIQPLQVWYAGGYAQDVLRPASNFTLTAGLRVDVPFFGDTAYPNPNVDVLTFRDETGAAVQYQSGKLPDPKPLLSPRLGFNWDVANDQRMQVRGGTGVFTGKPAYVWISNQIGNTGMLTGFIQDDNVTTRPFNPNPDFYKPATVTGAPAASVDLAVTDPDFTFPQTWRSNIGIDRRLPWGLIGTGEFIYNRDVNGVYYINANLPAAQSAFTGADNRPRWVGTSCSAPTPGPCVTRLNNTAGNQITNAIVLKNQNVGRSWNASASLVKTLHAGFTIKSAYSYGVSRNTIDAGSIASGSWTGNPMSADPNNPGLAYSSNSPGHRVFVATTYSKQYFGFGATTVSAFWEARTIGNASYVFSGDMNGDTASNNDLIYIHRDQSEMNFVQFTGANGHVYTPAEQAAAWDAYIAQDKYLSRHRGEYAGRGAVFLPMVKRMDLSLSQDLFHSLAGTRHSGQIRLDITNFGNLVNHNWGVGQRLVQNQILTNAAADAQGRATYRMAVVNNALPAKSLQTTTFAADVYTLMVSFRYNFN